MDAIEAINNHLTQDDIERILTLLGFSGVHLYGNDVRAKCLVHGGNNPSSFIFRSDIKLWYCHACGAFGDMVQLVEEIAGLDFRKSVEHVATLINLDITNLEVRKKPSLLQKDIEAWFKFSKKKKQSELESFTMPDVELKKIVQFRRFEKNTLDKYGLFYAKSFPITGKDGENYITYEKLMTPIWFNGKQVGVMLRRINKDEKRKWIIQPTNLDKDNLLYGLEIGHFYDEIIIVEGIFDVWAFNEIELLPNTLVVCLFGIHITDGQFKLLQQHTCNLTLALDGDEAGVTNTVKAIDQTKQKFNLYVIDFEGQDDPESIERNKLQSLYNNKIHYIEWRNKHDK